jgi:DNA replication and repair protein RecF
MHFIKTGISTNKFSLWCNFDISPSLFRINHINLIHFRNYLSASFRLDSQVSAICGLNGAGKTNLLDSVYYLCFTRSYLGQSDSASVRQGLSGFNITGEFQKKAATQSVSVILRETGKKELWVDKELVSPFSMHIGQLPVVFVAPDDTELITGGSEERRKMMDTIISQTDAGYLSQLIRYGKCLQDRNKYLKSCLNVQPDHLLLDAFDEQLIQSGTAILLKRTAFLTAFIPIVCSLFEYISDGAEHPELSYLPSTSVVGYRNDMADRRQKDILLQRTTIGIHRDDLEINLNGMPFRQIASQGQKKSMLFALKLAEFSILHSHFGFEPILLLDDIFEKLDQNRLNKLLDWVCIQNKGQVIMTDTHPDRITQAMEAINVPFKLLTP